MAEVALASLLRVVLQNLASPVVEEFGLLWGVNNELESLSSSLKMIQAVLEDASKWQNQGTAMGVWLARLEDVAYDADDILDEFATVAKLRDLATGSQSGKAYKVRRFLSSLDPSKIIFQHDMAHRIKKLKNKFDEIRNESFMLSLRQSNGQRVLEVSWEPSTSSFIDESKIVGRENDKEMIVRFLVFNAPLPSDSNLRVLPILGIGGLGKTTLAQLVYNDYMMKAYFHLRIWICVPEIFHATQLTKAIIESVTFRPCDPQKQLNALQEHLVTILHNRRYLLVLDNVWDDNNSNSSLEDQWNRLKVPLMYGAPGSTVIVTTRSQVVASSMGTIPYYPLQGMSDQDCLSVFNQNAFGNGNPDAHPNLVQIGREIVRKCSGLPLAAKTLGGLLSSKLEEYDWKVILNSDTWNLHSAENGNGVLAALKLSYKHLPSHLKQCFAFCSLFPKGYIFNRDELIRLWMAEGFIHPKEGEMTETVGLSYLDSLLKRSLFEYAHRPQQEKSKYILHDLVHDLAQSISGDSYLRQQTNQLNNTTKTRHLSICGRLEERMFKASLRSKNLRTFLLLTERCEWFEKVPSEVFYRLKRLRVLRLNNMYHKVRMLPNSIADMKHLRYLDLSYSILMSVPSSIHNLYNLQVLKLKHTRLKKLPRSIGNLINIRYLDLSGTRIRWLPDTFGNLINLQHLDLSSTRLASLPESFSNLCSLLHLSLSRSGFERLPEFIGNLITLQHLDLSSNEIRRLPESICKLYNLQNLIVGGCLLFELPSRTGDLVNLQYLYVGSCRNLISMSPGIGSLTSLQTLPFFIVGRAPGCGLGQLKSLNNLRGNLHILKLENSTDLEESTLKNKPYVSELRLEWSGTYMSNIPRDGEAENQLLENLQPHPNLTTLEITYYSGTELPSWLGNPALWCLTTIKLSQCLKLKIFPPIGQLHSLKNLEISGNDEVTSIGQEFIGQGLIKGFPSLERLSIFNMRNLEEWTGVGENDFPRLTEISIIACRKLKTMPYHLSGVATMSLSVSHQLNSLPLLPNIQELELSGCGENAFNSLPQLTSLVSLKIFHPDSDCSLPKTLMQPLCALKTLVFDRCDDHFDASKWEGLECPVSLWSLVIQGFFHLTQLPENSWPTTIKFLRFDYLLKVEVLPRELRNLRELLKLEIERCPKLRYLPEEGLPPTVELLHIIECPLLAKRCKKNKGKDWHKVAHIPYLKID